MFYEKACELGNAGGCNNLGVLYIDGLGVNQDYIKAAELFKKACDMGLELGCEKYVILKGRGN
jgi:TPR repeat protein